MPKYFLFFLFGMSCSSIFAQQPSNYSLYMFNRAAFNPAYAGMEESLSFTGAYRRQWNELQGSPISQNLSLHMPLYILSGGIGINIEREELGWEENLTASLAYNIQIPMGTAGILAIGASGGIVQKTLDGAALLTPEGDYEGIEINHNDNLPLPTSRNTAMIPSFAAGIYFKSETFEAGLSSLNLREPTLEGDFFSFTLRRNYFVSASYQLDLFRSLSVNPSFLIKSDLVEYQTDVSVLFKYNDRILIGGGLRGYNSSTLDAISILTGLKLSEKLTLAYAYDYTLSDLSTVSTGTHEILLNYNLGQPIGKGKLPRIIYNPRYIEK